jgi:hypothetical protein
MIAYSVYLHLEVISIHNLRTGHVLARKDPLAQRSYLSSFLRHIGLFIVTSSFGGVLFHG